MAERDFRKEAADEITSREALFEWLKQRAGFLREHISAYDVLRRFGVQFRYATEREEQFPCPFHGADNKPSARVYPSDGKSVSHAWCFVCQEKGWDSVGLWRRFTGDKFSRAISEMERAFGIMPPPRPKGGASAAFDDGGDDGEIKLDDLYDICERRLRNAKPAFDMTGFLTLGSVLDRLRNSNASSEMARKILNQVLEKIGQKERACLVE